MIDKWTISKMQVADLLKLDLLARRREVEEKLALFERTYGQEFDAFEQGVLGSDEDFTRWDDYLEWKAYRRIQEEIQQKLEALSRGHFEVA